GAAIVARGLGAFRRLREAPEAVAAELRQAAAELAALEGATPSTFHAAAMLHEAAAILAERPRFFLRGHDWLAEHPAPPRAAEATA
ncbi:hypothetical protein, partial [Pseudoroseomonas ludipueritiae]